jgi:hypothetical protein
MGDATPRARARRGVKPRCKASGYLHEVAGPDGRWFDQALARFWDESLDSGAGNFESRLLARFWRIYPQKCRYVGEEALRKLMQGGVCAARDLGMESERGLSVLLMMMFLFGSGFVRDTMYPFAQQVANDRNIANANARADTLRARAIEYLNQWYSQNRS